MRTSTDTAEFARIGIELALARIYIERGVKHM